MNEKAFEGFGHDAKLIAGVLVFAANFVGLPTNDDYAKEIKKFRNQVFGLAAVYCELAKEKKFEWSIEGLTLNDINEIKTILTMMVETLNK